MRTGTPFTACTVTACVALVAVLAAGGAEWLARGHRQQADWQLARATAHADGYVQTFDGKHVDAQLAAFGERRAVLARAERWEQGRALALLVAGVLLVVAYGQWFAGRLEACRLDGPGSRFPVSSEPTPTGALASAQG